jgi:hypothetical protein
VAVVDMRGFLGVGLNGDKWAVDETNCTDAPLER